MISTSLLAENSTYLWQIVIDGANWRVVQTSSGVYWCQRTIFWTFRPNANVCLRFCDQKKNQVILLRDQSDLVEISRKGLYFYIMQLPIKPKCSDLCSVLDRIFGLILVIRWNSGLILKIRPSACRHLKDLCQLGLRPEFVKSRTVSAVCEGKRHTEQSVGVWGRRPWMESTALKIHI